MLLALVAMAACTGPAPTENAGSPPAEGGARELVEITNGTVTVDVVTPPES